MARNHRGFIDATVAGAKLGADILFLNTAFAGPQLVEVLEREDPKVVVYDEEFSELLAEVDNVRHVVAWTDERRPGRPRHGREADREGRQGRATCRTRRRRAG